jgi:hypothetical protein
MSASLDTLLFKEVIEKDGVYFSEEQIREVEKALYLIERYKRNAEFADVEFNKDASYDLKIRKKPSSREEGDKGEHEAARGYSGASILDTNLLTAEVKYESGRWMKTGNVFIEIFVHGKPSGLSISDADAYVFVLGDTNTDLESSKYIVPREKLKLWLYLILFRFGSNEKNKRRSSVRIARGGDNNESFGVIVPRSMLHLIDKVYVPNNYIENEAYKKIIADHWNIDGQFLREFGADVTDTDIEMWELAKKNGV